MEKYIIALDQGTTSSRCIVFDREERIVAMAQKETTQFYPQAGWVEQDPMEIYATISGTMSEAMAQGNIRPEQVEAIGITNQRETTILWDKETGQPVYNAIVWQCRRTADFCRTLKEEGLEDTVRDKTGLLIDGYFSATKIRWVLDNVPSARRLAQEGRLLFGTVDTWLLWKLTGGAVHKTDYTNASRTMLYNIHTLEWDEELLNILDIPREILPEVCDSSGVFGRARLGDCMVPVAGIAGDQQAALFGQACFEEGDCKNTYGTGCFLLMNTGKKIARSQSGLVTTIACGLNGQVTYALEGSVFAGGSVVQWLRDEMRFIVEAPDSEYFASKTPDNGGVYFVPAFTGLGAPYWDMYARGAILGLTRGTSRNHIIRAALEAIAYQSNDVLQATAQDSGLPLRELRVDGGASRNGFLMQFQADISDIDVIRPKNTETTALGAAYLAGLATGVWKSLAEIKRHKPIDQVYHAAMKAECRRKNLEGWNSAVGRVLTQPR